MSEWRVPLSDISFGDEESAAVQDVLRSGWLSMGPEVEALEQEFAEILGTKHAVAVSNGTVAIQLAMAALELAPQAEVIQPALNFVAAANITIALGSIPVFADTIALDEPTIDPAEIERRISERTRAVLVMHYAGYICRMAEIASTCKAHDLFLIEDACHAVGARYEDSASDLNGRMAGRLGDVACFSFFSNKNLATGEGGMVTTDRDDLAVRLRLLRSHGMTTLTWDRYRGHASSYDVVAHGFNFRFDELRAALGRVQLQKLTKNNKRRQELVLRYRERLRGTPGIEVPFEGYDCGEPAFHLLVVVAEDAASRESAAAALRENKIQTSLHYPCVADFSAFRAYRGAEVPNTRAFAERALTLPLYPELTESQVDEICSILSTAVSGAEARA